MPNAFRRPPQGFRFFFFSDEGNEPAHVHVEKGGGRCKFWLIPMILEWNDGFDPSDLRTIRRIIAERHQEILDAWNEHRSKK
jgi:hypothetical protein